MGASSLQPGERVYIDRTFTFTSVPSAVQGAQYIRTANNDKSSTGTAFLSFAVNEPVTVYVAYDLRHTPPSWFADFTDTGLNLISTDVPLRLLAKAFPAGTVTLGGNRAEGTGGNSMYAVIIQP